MKRLVVLAFITLASFSADAATLYVDWDTGTDNATCGDVDAKCKTPWYTSANRVSAGDTIIVGARGDGNPYYNSGGTVLSVTDNTIWQVATGEVVRFSHTSTWGTESHTINNPVVSFSGANSTVDGFYIWGQVLVEGSDNNTIRNCDLSGGVGGKDNFCSPVYLWGNNGTPCSAWVTGTVIRNNKIHDNKFPSGCDQAPLTMSYCDDGTLYENNEIYNDYNDSEGSALWQKKGPANTTIRYNFFHNNAGGDYRGCEQVTDVGSGNAMYQNIFIPSDKSFWRVRGYDGSNPYLIYNNTFYGESWDGDAGSDSRVSFFNNIVYRPSAGYAIRKEGDTDSTSFTYIDYNAYYPEASTTWLISDYGYSTICNNTTLAAWSSCLASWGGTTGNEANSVTTDPGFLNATGNWNVPTDFKRTAYTANGRGTPWSDVMGAYITGSETIGLSSGDSTPDAFTFTDNTGVALSTAITSDSVQVLGIDNEATMVLSGDGTCEYSVNGAAWATATDNVALSDNVALRVTSSANHSTAKSCTLTIGGMSDTWSATTLAGVEATEAPRFRGASMSGGWR